MDKIRILIADDHAVVRQGTRNLLDQEPDMKVVAEASDGEEAVMMAAELMPDVILMDIAMPHMDGIEATRQIKAECPDINILVLSAYDDDQFVFKLLQAGAAGYVLKDVHGHELIAVVRAVYHGESVLHPKIARKVMARFMASPGKPAAQASTDGLSDREIELLQLMTRGSSNKEIADELCLSIRTVQGHVQQIFKKLEVSSRTEAVVYALKKGLVELEDMPGNDLEELPKE